ncbi:MAG TPA: prepilin-type N-terminal cleavage/methylation domain-containing protein [Anaeromyxobacteraceae bacterium]|nr:prepilin-type N-terminal cleavage/methylation domain-containing protein [Anaeromyxobacteraceae bacterium]
MMTKRSAPRGFTLIELMMVVATVGMLASIALPEFEHMTARSKLAERDNILRGVAKAVEDVTLNATTMPTNQGAFFNGAWNPDANPSTTRRAWVQNQAGWNQLPMIVYGATYCSYFFSLDTAAAPVQLVITGDCDIDGDGIHNTRVQTYQGLGNAFILTNDTTFNPDAF